MYQRNDEKSNLNNSYWQNNYNSHYNNNYCYNNEYDFDKYKDNNNYNKFYNNDYFKKDFQDYYNKESKNHYYDKKYPIKDFNKSVYSAKNYYNKNKFKKDYYDMDYNINNNSSSPFYKNNHNIYKYENLYSKRKHSYDDDYYHNYYNKKNSYFDNDYDYYDFYTDSFSDDDFDEEFYDEEFLDEDEYYQIKTLEDKNENGRMYELPNIKDRLIVLDTEVSGKTEKDQIIELCAFEMIKGKIQPKNKFHSFFKPKTFMRPYLIKIHRIPYKAFFYTENEEREFLKNFLSFVKDSLIITHNATFDMEMINKSLKYHNLPLISSSQFRCSMRIFWEKYNFITLKFCKLRECCDFLNIKYRKHRLHLASYDAFLVGKIMEKIYKDEEEKEKEKEKEKKILSGDFKFNENNNINIIEKENFELFNDNNKNEKKNKEYLDKNNKNKKEDEDELQKFIDKNIESILDELNKEDSNEKIIDKNNENSIEDKKQKYSIENYINDKNEEILSLINNDEQTEDNKFLGKKRK